MSAEFKDLVHENFDVPIRVGHLEDLSLVARKLTSAIPSYAQVQTIYRNMVRLHNLVILMHIVAYHFALGPAEVDGSLLQKRPILTYRLVGD